MPSLASTAKLIVVLAQTEPQEPIHRGTTYFLVPADSAGVEVTKVWDKISQRLVGNAQIEFHGVEVLADGVLGARAGRSQAPQDVTAAGGNITAAATALGTARTAYELAVARAREHIQGGRPIIEHQAIGMMLAQMATEPIQKLMRDALAFLHSDGTQQGRLLVIQQQLLDGKLP